MLNGWIASWFRLFKMVNNHNLRWRWPWRPSLVLKSHEQESQRCVGSERGWISQALLTACCISSSCWQLDTKVLVSPWMVLYLGAQCATMVSPSLRINVSLCYVCFPPILELILCLHVAICHWWVSPNKMICGNLLGCILDMWLDQWRWCCWWCGPPDWCKVLTLHLLEPF